MPNNCSIMQCSHNKNGECLGKMPKQCNNYPVPEYLSRDQLLAINAPTEDDIKFWEFCNDQQEEEELKDCTSCGWGMFNDHWDMPFCYCPDVCIKWDQWKEKDNGDRDSN